MPEIVLATGGREVRRRKLGEAPMSVGRSTANDLVIEDPQASRNHGRLVKEGPAYAYLDLDSTHGSFLNGSKVARRSLKDGDAIRIGAHELVFLAVDGSPLPTAGTETPVTKVGPSWGEFATVLAGPAAGRADEGARRLQALFEITRSLDTGQDFDAMLGQILDRAIAIMGAERGFLMLRDASDGKLRPHVARGTGADIAGIDKDTVSHSLMRRVADSGEPVLVRNALSVDEGATQSMLINRIHSALCVPLKARNEVSGVLYVDHRTRRSAFDDQDLAFFSTFAVQAQAAIEWGRAYWELVESLFAASDDVIVVLGVDGVVRQVNQGAAKLLGTARGELAGRRLEAMVAEGEGGAVASLIEETLASGVCSGRELTLALADGRRVPLSISSFAMRDRQGGNAGLCIIGRDFSDLKSVVSMLTTANAELKAVNERKEQFVGMITHEFKSPLAVVMGYGDILSKTGVDEAHRLEYMSKIMLASNRMLAMCQELLELMRVETGVASLALEDVDAAVLLREVVEYCSVRAKDKKVTVLLEGAPGPLVVRADRNLLWRVFDNFVGNGIKYNKDGGRLWVRTGSDDHGARFEFQDEGIGMGEEDQKKLFGQFFRAANARKIAGTGLGLSIVKSIIDRHGGTVEFKSALGQGTTFTVHWPVFSPPEPG